MARSAAAAVVALALLGGCGGDESLSHAEYQERVRPITVAVQEKVFKLSIAVTRAPAPQLATARIQTLRKALAGARQQLTALEPPADAQEAHDDVLAGLEGLDPELAEAEGSTREAEYEGWPSFLDDLVATDAYGRLSRGLSGLQEAGYELEL